ncbi:MAG: tetratricopeptide repeat protein [Immundisolibacterales bacterium]|nr:tetratricopeptide repeat protein [Immundisolibacterales bacterium]
MLIRSVAAGVVAVLLAGCAGAPPDVLPPVREGLLTSDPKKVTSAPQSIRAPLATPDDTSVSRIPVAARPGATGSGATPSATEADAPRALSRDERRRPDEGRGVAEVPSFPDGRRAPARESATVLALLASAREAREAGRYGRAAAALERALKVEPRNPRLWHRLALVRFRQGRPADAAALALRSLSLTGDDADLESRNLRLIAAARHALGDEEGAREALRRAEAR